MDQGKGTTVLPLKKRKECSKLHILMSLGKWNIYISSNTRVCNVTTCYHPPIQAATTLHQIILDLNFMAGSVMDWNNNNSCLQIRIGSNSTILISFTVEGSGSMPIRVCYTLARVPNLEEEWIRAYKACVHYMIFLVDRKIDPSLSSQTGFQYLLCLCKGSAGDTVQQLDESKEA